MKRWRYGLICMGILFTCTATASAHTHPGETPRAAPTVSAWASDAVEEAGSAGLIPRYGLPDDYRLPITRGQYRAVAMQFVAVQAHCDTNISVYGTLDGLTNMYFGVDTGHSISHVFADGERADDSAYYLGLIQGRGDGTFDPDGRITRQEAAVMLTRAYQVCGGVLPETADPPFPDWEQIAPWARESAAALTAWGVMEGKPEGAFAPEDDCTIEECLTTFLRLYEQAPMSRKNGNMPALFTYDQCEAYIAANTISPEILVPGRYETVRVEGSIATFLRLDMSGYMKPTTAMYFLYRDGGMRRIDVGLCSYPESHAFSAAQLVEDCRFSEAGDEFYCTVTLKSDIYREDILVHEKGVYYVTVQVDSCESELRREEFPA